MASNNPVSSTTATTTVVTETSEGNEETLRLKLKKGEAEKKKIQWTEDTVDNEGEPPVHTFTFFESFHSHFLFRFGEEEKQSVLPV